MEINKKKERCISFGCLHLWQLDLLIVNLCNAFQILSSHFYRKTCRVTCRVLFPASGQALRRCRSALFSLSLIVNCRIWEKIFSNINFDESPQSIIALFFSSFLWVFCCSYALSILKIGLQNKYTILLKVDLSEVFLKRRQKQL
jgi:hypothetical protein